MSAQLMPTRNSSIQKTTTTRGCGKSGDFTCNFSANRTTRLFLLALTLTPSGLYAHVETPSFGTTSRQRETHDRRSMRLNSVGGSQDASLQLAPDVHEHVTSNALAPAITAKNSPMHRLPTAPRRVAGRHDIGAWYVIAHPQRAAQGAPGSSLEMAFSKPTRQSDSEASKPRRKTNTAKKKSNQKSSKSNRNASRATDSTQPKYRLPRHFSKLNLTEDQQLKIKSLQAKLNPRIAELEQEVNELRAEREKALLEILSRSQRQKLKTITRPK